MGLLISRAEVWKTIVHNTFHYKCSKVFAIVVTECQLRAKHFT